MWHSLNGFFWINFIYFKREMKFSAYAKLPEDSNLVNGGIETKDIQKNPREELIVLLCEIRTHFLFC